MSFAPKSISDLAAYWVSQGGVNLGIVGNAVHCKGYHLGEDRVFGDCACRPKGVCVPGLGSQDYSVILPRDKRGLSNAASALDLGRLNGSLQALYDFSAWLVKRCQSSAPGTADIRDIIYSPDGKVVLRYDRERGVTSSPRPGEADASHLSHTHLSFYRDGENRDKVGLFAPYFLNPPDTSTDGESVAGDYVVYDEDVQSIRTAAVKAGTAFYNDWALTSKRGTISSDSRVQLFGFRGDAYAVQVRTAQGFADNVVRPLSVFISKDDASDIQSGKWPTDETHKVSVSVDGKIAWEGTV